MDYYRNRYFCYIDEKKMTESEWNNAHAEELTNYDPLVKVHGYYYCDSYEAYSKSFDECMESQIKNREVLRKWYKRMAKEPYVKDFCEDWSGFSDCFKGCYGYRPNFLEKLLARKGVTIDTYRNDMNAYINARRN